MPLTAAGAGGIKFAGPAGARSRSPADLLVFLAYARFVHLHAYGVRELELLALRNWSLVILPLVPVIGTRHTL